MTAINLAMSAQIQGGPQLSETRSIPVEAYDLVKVTLDPDGNEKVVEIHPGNAARVDMLLIRASRYAPEITYKVSDGAADTAALELAEPHLYTAGMIDLFGIDPPQLLKLKNTLPNAPANKVDIEVFVGRDATP